MSSVIATYDSIFNKKSAYYKDNKTIIKNQKNTTYFTNCKYQDIYPASTQRPSQQGYESDLQHHHNQTLI